MANAISNRCVACGRRVPWMAFFGNLSLTFYKVTVGVLGGSKALIADGLHSFTDVIGTSVILFSTRVSARPPDSTHPYGHGKAEFMSSAFIYLVLLLIGGGLFTGGLLVVIHWDLKEPSFVTLLGGVVSIIYNLIMHRLGLCAGRKNNSPALLANAFENRADAISSVAVVIGIALAMYVHPVCDPLAAMAVGVIIFVNCIVELRKAMDGLMDRSLPLPVVQRIRNEVLTRCEVRRVSFVKTRPMGTNYWVDLGIQVQPGMSITRAEALAAEVRQDLMSRSKHFHTVEVFVTPEVNRKPTKELPREPDENG